MEHIDLDINDIYIHINPFCSGMFLDCGRIGNESKPLPVTSACIRHFFDSESSFQVESKPAY